MARSAEPFFQSYRFLLTVGGQDVPACEVTSEPHGRLKLRTGHMVWRAALASLAANSGVAEIKIWSKPGRGTENDQPVQWIRKYGVTFTGVEDCPLDLNALNGNVAMDAIVLTGVSYTLAEDVCVPAPPNVPSLSDIARQHPEIATR